MREQLAQNRQVLFVGDREKIEKSFARLGTLKNLKQSLEQSIFSTLEEASLQAEKLQAEKKLTRFRQVEAPAVKA